MHVRFQGVHANVDGAAKRAHGVFRILGLVSAMRNGLRHAPAMAVIFACGGEGGFRVISYIYERSGGEEEEEEEEEVVV